MLDNKTSQTRDQVWSSKAPRCFWSHSQSTQARLSLKILPNKWKHLKIDENLSKARQVARSQHSTKARKWKQL